MTVRITPDTNATGRAITGLRKPENLALVYLEA